MVSFRLAALLEEASLGSPSPTVAQQPDADTLLGNNASQTKARASILAKAVRKSNFAGGLRKSLFNPLGGTPPLHMEEDSQDHDNPVLGFPAPGPGSLGIGRTTSAPPTLIQGPRVSAPSREQAHQATSLGFSSAPVVPQAGPGPQGLPQDTASAAPQGHSVRFSLGGAPVLTGATGPHARLSTGAYSAEMTDGGGQIRQRVGPVSEGLSPEKVLLQKRATLRPTWGGSPQGPPQPAQPQSGAEDADAEEEGLSGLALQLRKELQKRRASAVSARAISASAASVDRSGVEKPSTGASGRTPAPPPLPAKVRRARSQKF